MFSHGSISTEVDKKPFVFTVVALSGSLIGAVLLFVFSKREGLAIFAGIMLGLIFLASAAVLFAMVTDQAYIENDTLFMRYMFRKSRIPLKEIGKVSYKDNVHSIYNKKGALVGTINAQLTGIDKILYQLEKSGASFV